jgi:MFS family permease
MLAERARRDWRVYIALTFLFSFGFNAYNAIFQNFFRDVHHATPTQLGALESLRETPGLLAALMAGTLVSLAEARIAALALGICAVGMAATGFVGSYWGVVAASVAWSVGFHLWASVSPAITLALAEHREGGLHLGRMAGVGSFAVVTSLLITRLVKPYVSYRTVFISAAIAILIAGVMALFLSERSSTKERQSILIRREYSLFYLLTFLEGCRRQVFGTFASFALILVYHFDVTTMLTLALVNAAVGTMSQPLVGRMIDRIGEKRVLTAYYVMLILVFGGYAKLSHPIALYALFQLDGLLFPCAMAITTFLHRIARTNELTPSLAMGTTMNHVAAVIVPVTGGLLWKAYGYRLPFLFGIGVVILSLIATQVIPARMRQDPGAASVGA